MLQCWFCRLVIWTLDLGLQAHCRWEFCLCLSVPWASVSLTIGSVADFTPSPPHPGQPFCPSLLVGGPLYSIDDTHSFPAVLILEDISPKRPVCSSWLSQLLVTNKAELSLSGFKWRLAHSCSPDSNTDPIEAVTLYLHVLSSLRNF